jgi:predicted DNA-binding helix-hairpin-helix protein
LEHFPVEIMTCDYEQLLRVPGIGQVSAQRILAARRVGTIRWEDLSRLGVVVKRAQYFITCAGHMRDGLRFSPATMVRQLETIERGLLPHAAMEQLSLFDATG